MNLAQKIREAWRDADGFQTIIPLENISTELCVCDALPYGIIHPTETTVGPLTNSGPKIHTWKATVEFHVATLPAANVIHDEAEIIFCPEKHFVVEANIQDCIDVNHWKITVKLFYWTLN